MRRETRAENWCNSLWRRSRTRGRWYSLRLQLRFCQDSEFVFACVCLCGEEGQEEPPAVKEKPAGPQRDGLQGATAAAAAQKGLIQADLSGWRWLSRWHSHEEAAAQWEHGVRAFIKIHTVDGKTLEFQTQWCGNVKPYSRQVFFIRKQGLAQGNGSGVNDPPRGEWRPLVTVFLIIHFCSLYTAQNTTKSIRRLHVWKWFVHITEYFQVLSGVSVLGFIYEPFVPFYFRFLHVFLFIYANNDNKKLTIV